MILITSANARYSDVLKRLNKAKSDYAAQMSEYTQQEDTYDTAKSEFYQKFINNVKAAIGQGLLNIFGENLRINIDTQYDYRTNSTEYIIKITYTSDRNESKYTTRGRYYFRGVPFSLSIFINDREGEKELIHSPVLDSIGAIGPEDYEVLQNEIQLFKVIDTIDWKSMLEDAKSSAPKKSEYVSLERPSPVDYNQYDKERANIAISKAMGKDLWISVQVDRGPSFDYNTYDYSDVIGDGFARFEKQTPAYYFFNWIPGRYANSVKSGTLHETVLNRACNRLIKLKKAYFLVPDNVVYISTDEISDNV